MLLAGHEEDPRSGGRRRGSERDSRGQHVAGPTSKRWSDCVRLRRPPTALTSTTPSSSSPAPLVPVRPPPDMQSVPQALHEASQPAHHDNRSSYSLATVYNEPLATPRTALLSGSRSIDHSYGTTSPAQPSTRRILMNATLKMAAIFVISTAFLGATLWLALPTLDE